ncbi:MFS transporter [Ramlibacter sp.]|uniref:MFS transporter n=1 Tax=Ramlibacter sp. TaxID=1917967 RepID=UPI003D09F13A
MVQNKAGRWYFGWNIVAAASLLTLLSSGMRLSMGPFFLPMARDLGFSRSLLAAIVAVGMICYGLAMPFAGWLVARRGTRFVLLAGVAMVAVSVVWAVLATSPTPFLLSFGILLSVGLAFASPVSVTPVITYWFTRQRGKALFFLSTGSMAGIAVMTPVLTFAVETFGWRATLLGYGAAFTLIAIPLAVFVFRDAAPEHADLLPAEIEAMVANPPPASKSLSVAQVLRTVPFWMIFAGMFACGFSMNLLGTHGVPMLMDHGYDAFTSAAGIGVIGFVAIFGTMVLGRMADRFPRRHLLAAIYGVRGIGFFVLVVVGTHFELYLAATIGGLVWAGSIALSSAILADVYGVRTVGVLYGLAYVGHQLGGMLSAWLGGWGYETFGTHWIAFGASGALLVAAAALSLRLPPRGFRLMADGAT